MAVLQACDPDAALSPVASADQTSQLEVGDMVTFRRGAGVPPEFSRSAAVITQVAASYCTAVVLDEARRHGIGECWPASADCVLETKLLRLGRRVRIAGLRASRTQVLNGSLGTVVAHPGKGHPTFICAKAASEPRLTVSVRLEDPPAGFDRLALLEPQFLRMHCGDGTELSCYGEGKTTLDSGACGSRDRAETSNFAEAVGDLTGALKSFDTNAPRSSETNVVLGEEAQLHTTPRREMSSTRGNVPIDKRCGETCMIGQRVFLRLYCTGMRFYMHVEACVMCAYVSTCTRLRGICCSRQRIGARRGSCGGGTGGLAPAGGGRGNASTLTARRGSRS